MDSSCDDLVCLPALRTCCSTQTRPVPTWPGLHGSAGPHPGGQEHSLINTVGSGDDPHRGDDRAPAQVVALELKAGLPGPLCGGGHVSTHDARAVAHPPTTGCGGRTGLGSIPQTSPLPATLTELTGWEECWEGTYRVRGGGRLPGTRDEWGVMEVLWKESTRAKSPKLAAPLLQVCMPPG